MKDLLTLSVGGTQINPPGGIPKADLGVDKILSNGLSLFITAGIAVSVIMIAWAGIQWATSRGEKEKVAAARAKLTWAIVGVVIMLAAFFIINIFGFLFGIDLLDFKLQ